MTAPINFYMLSVSFSHSLPLSIAFGMPLFILPLSILRIYYEYILIFIGRAHHQQQQFSHPTSNIFFLFGAHLHYNKIPIVLY